MTVEGLDRVRRMAGAGSHTIDSETRKAVRDSAAIVRSTAVGNARKFSIGNLFPSSIRYRVTGLTAEIGSMAATALSIETGRRSGEIVRFGLILSWIKRKGIVGGVFKISTRKIARAATNRVRTGDVSPEELKEAARIVALIRARGTKPLAFLIPALESQERKINQQFNDAVKRALSKLRQAA